MGHHHLYKTPFFFVKKEGFRSLAEPLEDTILIGPICTSVKNFIVGSGES